MACNNDGGPERRVDKCDKRGRESAGYLAQDFFIPSSNTDNILEKNIFVVDLYGNMDIEFE